MHRSALEDVLQLAEIAGPRVLQEQLLGVGRELEVRRAELCEHLVGEREKVLSTFAQRRQRHANGTDPVVEVGAKLLLSNGGEQGVMSRREEAHVDRTLADVAHATEPLLFESLEELGLDLEIDVADLVEKERAAIRGLEQSLLRSVRAGERAALVTKELRLDELPGKACAVDVDEWCAAPRADLVNAARKHALTGAGLAEQEHCAVDVAELFDLLLDSFHRARAGLKR